MEIYSPRTELPSVISTNFWCSTPRSCCYISSHNSYYHLNTNLDCSKDIEMHGWKARCDLSKTERKLDKICPKGLNGEDWRKGARAVSKKDAGVGKMGKLHDEVAETPLRTMRIAHNKIILYITSLHRTARPDLKLSVYNSFSDLHLPQNPSQFDLYLISLMASSSHLKFFFK